MFRGMPIIQNRKRGLKMPEKKVDMQALGIGRIRTEQTWETKLFTRLGDWVILDLGELLGLKIVKQLSENKADTEWSITAVMTGGIGFSLTKWFDSENKAQAMLTEFQSIIATRIRRFFTESRERRHDHWTPDRDGRPDDQTRRDTEAIEKGQDLEV